MIHNIPNAIINKTQTVKYALTKTIEQKGKIYIYVVNQQTGTIIYNTIISGNVGTPIMGIVPSDISEGNNGYKIQSITVNGTITTESQLPKIFTNGEKEIIYKVVPINGSLTYKIFLGSHELRQSTSLGKPGTEASYVIPQNSSWELQSISIDCKTIITDTPILQQKYKNYHGEYKINGNTIIYHFIKKQKLNLKQLQ